MSNASTLLHYIRLLAVASDVKLSRDCEAEIIDIIESTEARIARLEGRVKLLEARSHRPAEPDPLSGPLARALLK